MKKILSFIVNKDNQLLLLHNNPEDPIHGGDIWYTVTGGVEEYDKTLEDAVRREVKEETNLDVLDMMYLNIQYSFVNRVGIECHEYAYISFVDDNDIILNEESIGYKWLDINTFVDEIHWYSNKNDLKVLLEQGIKKELYYQEEQHD